MKNILIISFDLISPDEPALSLSIATTMAFMKTSPLYKKAFQLHHRSFDLVKQPKLSVIEVMETISKEYDLPHLNVIAISCYIWSEYLVNPLIKLLRLHGYSGAILLGGYQIQYSESLETEYPDCQIYIKGYAEESLLQVATNPNLVFPLVLNTEPDFESLPSPYLSGDIHVKQQQGKVRIETKRGCPYRCSFCAHRDLQRNKVYSHPRDRAFAELSFLTPGKCRK